MKESLWGYWLIIFGIAVITFMMLIQSYVTIEQEDYYLLKEVTQAAMYDSIDFVHYNKYGELKINREVFIENFERRFASSVKGNKIYKTDFYEIYETPPKVSVRISTTTGSFSIMNDFTNLDVINDIDAILEFNGKDVVTTDFYSLTYAPCTEYNMDAMGYCSYMNTYALYGNTFKESAAEYLKVEYPTIAGITNVKQKNIEIVDVTYVGNMSQDDFQKYVDKYEVTYGKDYNDSGAGRVTEVKKENFATEIKDVSLLTTSDEKFGWSLKYKCKENPTPIKTAGGNVEGNCLIGIKYQIKFRYTIPE